MSEIPQGWMVVPLADLTDRITKGTTPKTYGHQFQAKGIRFVRAESLSGREINHAKCLYVSDEAHAEFQRSQLQPADVLVTIAGTLGRIALVKAQDTPANTNQAVAICRPSEKALAPYIARYLEGEITAKAVDSGGRGTGLQNLNLKQVGEFEIRVPPLPEQRRIVAKLDRLSARSAAARDHLARTTKLATRAKQTVLREYMDTRSGSIEGDSEVSCTLGDLGKWSSGGTPSSKRVEFYGGEIPWIRSGDLPDHAVTEHVKTITNAGLQGSSAKWVPPGSVLIAMYGATIGKLGITTYPVTTNQAVASLQPKQEVSVLWAFYMLLAIRPELVAIAQGGAQPNISQTLLKRWPVALPTLEVQEARVRRIEAAFARIDRLTEEASRAAHLLDRLDDRLLAKAFRGELVPQDPDDEPAEALLTRIREARAAAPKAKQGRRKKAEA